MKYSLLLILAGLTGCATAGKAPAESVKTWLIMPTGLRHHAGQVDETKAFTDAQGYRCYSPEDDLAWRDRLAAAEAGCAK